MKHSRIGGEKGVGSEASAGCGLLDGPLFVSLSCDLRLSSVMKIRVINLPRAADRRDAMERQLKGLGLAFEFHQGMDWRELADEDWAEVDLAGRSREGRRALTPGMVGCHLSHRRLLREIADGDAARALVLEDDILLDSSAPTALAAIEASLPARRYDLIFLHRNRPDRRFVSLFGLNADWRLGLVRYVDFGALAYVVSRSGARKFLQRWPRLRHQADHAMHAYWETGLLTAYLDPPVAFHEGRGAEHSLLGETRTERARRSGLSHVPKRFVSLAKEGVCKPVCFYRRLLRERAGPGFHMARERDSVARGR